MYSEFIASVLYEHLYKPNHIRKLKGKIRSLAKTLFYFNESALSDPVKFPVNEKDVTYVEGRLWIIHFLELWEGRNRLKSKQGPTDNKTKRQMIMTECKRRKINLPPKLLTWKTVELNLYIDQLIEQSPSYSIHPIQYKCIEHLLNQYIPYYDLTFMLKRISSSDFTDLIYNDQFTIPSSNLSKRKFVELYWKFHYFYGIFRMNKNTFNFNLFTLQIVNLIFSKFYPKEKRIIVFSFSEQYEYTFDLTQMDLSNKSQYEITYILSINYDNEFTKCDMIDITTPNPFLPGQWIPVHNLGHLIEEGYHYQTIEPLLDTHTFITEMEKNHISMSDYSTSENMFDVMKKFRDTFKCQSLNIFDIYLNNERSSLYPLYIQFQCRPKPSSSKVDQYWERMKKAIQMNDLKQIQHLIQTVGWNDTLDNDIVKYVLENNCNYDILKLLVKAGANVDYLTEYDSSLLHILYVASKCPSNDLRKIARLLIKYGADPYQYDRENRDFLLGYSNNESDHLLLEMELELIKKAK